ncbi:Short-chain dehydrogenase [Aureimonas altamirensis DSM 21988]|jgi:NAD(P)-dependent dehydrogenase (short-subunit alcohol dehydrogenase family)|uniref:Short-chain dehydrogenase n=1 Tax=Aureimonas altamirensis DSM 21988 TaxID=1121026 RepID=A0ABY1IHD4_9HYPH|nr:SDR family oxidoreductase [Aureimonas altamirensis]SHJ17681.1 Short-chain dehydrogenase [Aureimonas altamirensis DSM 21988]
MQTVFITGSSTGFGREIALRFLNEGWNVVATMRNPAASTLPESDRLRVLPLDVTDAGSIRDAVAKAGTIDVLVNNAGIGWLNAVEGTPLDMARHIFETNTLGTIATMQAVLPAMRERRSGVIVNVSSSTTLAPMALLSVYAASKAAVNMLTQSAALELAEFGIRARVVLPGAAPTTSFGNSARALIGQNGGFPEAYGDFVGKTMEAMQQHAAGPVTTAEDVAEAVLRAATDPDCPMMLPAGADAKALAAKG